jgi:hypothetical protein
MEKFEVRMTFDGENYAEKYYVNGDRVPKDDFYELIEDEELEDYIEDDELEYYIEEELEGYTDEEIKEIQEQYEYLKREMPKIFGENNDEDNLDSELDLDTRRKIMLKIEEEILIMDKCVEFMEKVSKVREGDVSVLSLVRDFYESAYEQGKTDANLKVSKFLEEQE